MSVTLPDPAAPLRIGTRGSPLALAQAEEVRDRLATAFSLPFEAFAIEIIRTTGDRVIDRPLSEIGGKGLFTREIELALAGHRIDIAVHSMKDMPVEQPEGLVIDCILPREDPRDAYIALDGSTLAALPDGAVIGTSSLRRKAQVLHRNPALRVVEFRGNVQTRLAKLADGVAQATFLALAGLNRLDARDVPRLPLAPEDMLPAIAQGAIGVERRADDSRAAAMLEALHDPVSGARIAAERAFLARLDGSCQTPIAGLAEITGTTLRLRGEILRTDGSEALSDEASGAVEDGPEMGRALADALLGRAGPGFFDET